MQNIVEQLGKSGSMSYGFKFELEHCMLKAHWAIGQAQGVNIVARFSVALGPEIELNVMNFR